MNRKTCLISNTVGELLIKQLAHELKNYNLYKSFANYFSLEGIVELEEYYRKRAEEEMNHHSIVFDYLSEADYRFTYPAVEKNTETFDNHTTPFIQTIDREIQTTQMLFNIYEVALSEKDYFTAEWMLNGLLRENREEENTSRMALSIMEQDADIFVKADKVLDLLG